MANTGDMIRRWLDMLEGEPRACRLQGELASSNVFYRGATLYSYGTHFPLAEYHAAGAYGRRRPLYLQNGDRSTVTTSRHQREAQSAIGSRAAAQNADTIILPFSALDAAGIDRASIRPFEVRPDTWVTVAEVPVPVDLRDLASADETVTQSRPRYYPHTTPVDVTVYRWRADGYVFERDHYPDAESPSQPYVREWPDGAPRELAEDWRTLRTRRHRLGDSVFLADVPATRERSRPVSVRDVIAAAVRSIEMRNRGYDGILDVCETLDNVDPDEPIRETVQVRRRRRFVSSFDLNEPAPLYFLATLPRGSRAQTVDMAIEDLAPAAVHAAYARGRHVDRQGDIFVIETALEDADVTGFERARLTQWTHTARARRGEIGFVAPLRAAEQRAVITRARELYREKSATATYRGPVTGPGTRKRFAKLRAEHAASIAHVRRRARRAVFHGNGYAAKHAREGLALQLRRGAVDAHGNRSPAMARDAYRRHSLYGQTAAVDRWRDCITDAYREVRPTAHPDAVAAARERIREVLSIYGTAHSATEVARAPDGRTYVRGTLRHVPELEPGRRGGRDHVARKLRPDVWYLAVRNTVPRDTSARGGMRRR